MQRFCAERLIGRTVFRRVSGVDVGTFREMERRLAPHWERRESSKALSGRPHGVGGLADHLLVLLILYRCHVTQDFLGCLYGVDKASICRALKRIEPLAQRLLGVKRSIRIAGHEAQGLLLDCTEQAIERPTRRQRRWYSGKKKRHTIKTEMTMAENGRIISISRPNPGSRHDLAIRRRGAAIPCTAHIYADSGYQGLQADHHNLEIPYKRSKTKPLTSDEREYNRALSRVRIKIEHGFARIKKFRIMADTYRYPRPRYHAKFAIIAGICNIEAGF